MFFTRKRIEVKPLIVFCLFFNLLLVQILLHHFSMCPHLSPVSLMLLSFISRSLSLLSFLKGLDALFAKIKHVSMQVPFFP